MATTMNPAIDYHELIHEDRIHGSLYRDPDIFEEEFAKIWYRSWVYVGHESEVPEPGDYRTKQIGRQPVIMVAGREWLGQPAPQPVRPPRQHRLPERAWQRPRLSLRLPRLDLQQPR